MMNVTPRIVLLFLAVWLVFALAGCGASGSEPEPQDAWERVQETGRLVVGTSADYAPFAFYDDNFRITGFDPALIREIGAILGVDVELQDIAFDGLSAALTLGQIDTAIAAISVTPDREEVVDFSQIYYVSEDAILAAADADIGPIRGVQALADFTVGVQQASVFADWLQDNLIDTGLMPATDLFLYQAADQAIDDLRNGRVDLVVLDRLPAEAFVQEGGVQLVGSGLNRERYAIAIPEGDRTLQREINAALSQLQRDGVIADLVEEYLSLDEESTLPPPSPTPLPPTPTPAATTAPGTPTAAPTSPAPDGCLDSMEYVSDLNYDDRNMTAPPTLQPGEAFRKGWRVRNNGTCTWDSTYALTFVQGSAPGAAMGGQPTAISQIVPPGAVYDLYIDLVAPLQPGTYRGVWQMRNAQGQAFGQRLWVGITVPGGPAPTAVPTQTPAPNIDFNADRTSINADECVTFRWNVTNVREVYFYAEGQAWENNGVAGQAERRVCPDRTTTYFLRVVRNDGSVETRQITINVEGTSDAPDIDRFSVDPTGQIAPGQCVTLRWEVDGNIDRVNLTRNETTIWSDAPFRGSLQDCPPGTGTMAYGIEARGPGGTNRSLDYVDVMESAPTATPVPTAAPTDVPLPVIHAFSVNPNQINLGECVNLAWTTSGGSESTRVTRNGAVVLDSGPISTTGLQDCLTQTGSFTYVLEARNHTGQTVSQQVVLTVNAPEQPTPTPTAAPVAPVITVFSVDRNQIALGECVNLSWEFGGDSLALVRLFRNDEVIATDMASPGSQQDCPPAAGQVTYRLVVDSEFGGSTEQAQFVTVEQNADASGAANDAEDSTPPAAGPTPTWTPTG